jgi:IclR family transcriptional regulator, acetate operon repressor
MRRKGTSSGRSQAGEDLTGSSAKSLNKALDILIQLGRVPEGMSLADVALLAQLPKSTAHRLLTALEGRRFVSYEGDEKLWKIGVEAFVVGSAFLRNRELTTIARPILRALVGSCGETASLYLNDDGEIVCLAQIESRQAMRVIARPGGRAKMHAAGSGKAILAFMTEQDVSAVLVRHGLEAATENTIRTPERLRRELDTIRKAGFAIDDEENSLGIRCVAAPIFDDRGEAIGAISVSGPSSRMADDRIGVLGEQVRAASVSVTELFGGIPKVSAAKC